MNRIKIDDHYTMVQMKLTRRDENIFFNLWTNSYDYLKQSKMYQSGLEKKREVFGYYRSLVGKKAQWIYEPIFKIVNVNNTPVGFAGLINYRDGVELVLFFIPAFQYLKLDNAAIRLLIIHHQGCHLNEKLYFKVARNNRELMSLLIDIGFTLIGEVESYYSLNEDEMCWKLLYSYQPKSNELDN